MQKINNTIQSLPQLQITNIPSQMYKRIKYKKSYLPIRLFYQFPIQNLYHLSLFSIYLHRSWLKKMRNCNICTVSYRLPQSLPTDKETLSERSSLLTTFLSMQIRLPHLSNNQKISNSISLLTDQIRRYSQTLSRHNQRTKYCIA